MPNKPQERFLMREYKKYLVRMLGLPASFRANPNDPPDFWLTTGGLRYAVEVTNVVHEEDRETSTAQWDLVREAERETIDKGILSGRYIVAFRDPWVGRKQRNRFKRQIIDFVTQTSKVERTTKVEVVIDGNSLCDIEKYAGGGANIHPFGGGLNELGGFEDDLRNQLSPLITRAIKSKATKMAAYRPVVLILYDLFWLANQSTFVACVRAVPESKFFREIYVVQDKDRGFVVSFD